jgi:hypothetical protein
MIQRYDIWIKGYQGCDTGDWCRSEDVEKLEKKVEQFESEKEISEASTRLSLGLIEELKKLNKQLLDALNEICENYDNDRPIRIGKYYQLIDSITGKKPEDYSV